MVEVIVGVIVGALGSYLVFRNNPQLEEKVDDLTDKVEDKIKKGKK